MRPRCRRWPARSGRTSSAWPGSPPARRCWCAAAAAALRSRPREEKATIVAGVRAEVWPLIEAGRIHPVIDRRLPMADAATAHAVVERSEHLGKVLLVVGQ